MATVPLTRQNFERTVEKGIVLIDFWAAWCGPCRAFAPIFEAASGKHADVVFAKLDTQAEPGIAGAFQIHAIPTLVAMRDGIVLAAIPGVMRPAGIDDLLAKVRAVDMAEVRRSLKAQNPTAQERV